MNKLIYLLGPIKSQPITEPDLLRLQKKPKFLTIPIAIILSLFMVFGFH